MNIYSAKDFGLAIRTARKRQGYTQEQIADAAGVSLTYLIHLEKGKETAEIGKALRIASLLSMDIIAKERAA